MLVRHKKTTVDLAPDGYEKLSPSLASFMFFTVFDNDVPDDVPLATHALTYGRPDLHFSRSVDKKFSARMAETETWLSCVATAVLVERTLEDAIALVRKVYRR